MKGYSWSSVIYGYVRFGTTFGEDIISNWDLSRLAWLSAYESWEERENCDWAGDADNGVCITREDRAGGILDNRSCDPDEW